MPKVLNKRSFPPGHVVFEEGAKGNHAYVVQKGAVQIQKKAPNGGVINLGVIRDGGIFGEMALIDKSPRMATAKCLEKTDCIDISEDILHRKLDACDPAIRLLIIVLIRMIRTVAEKGRLPAEELEEVMEAAVDELIVE